jgi:hypothetical protein
MKSWCFRRCSRNRGPIVLNGIPIVLRLGTVKKQRSNRKVGTPQHLQPLASNAFTSHDDGAICVDFDVRCAEIFAMKPLWIALVLAATLVPAGAQQPKASARLDVKTARAGRTLTRWWETYYGSYDRDSLRATFLDIRLSTVGRVSFDAILEIVFHGKHPATKQPLVASWQTAPVRIEPGKHQRLIASSGFVHSNATRYAAFGTVYGTGTTVSSWHVRLRSGNTVVAEAHNGIPLDFTELAGMVKASVQHGILDSNKPEEARLKPIGLNDPL